MRAFTVMCLALVVMLGNGCASSPVTNNPHSVQAPQTNSPASCPLYGKASLSEEERRILYKPFDGMEGKTDTGAPILDWRRSLPKAYQLGMVCLKHRLNYSEVNELIVRNVTPRLLFPPEKTRINITISFSALLGFDFDEKGDLQKVQIYGIEYHKLPPLEAVTSNTPIEPPPMTR